MQVAGPAFLSRPNGVRTRIRRQQPKTRGANALAAHPPVAVWDGRVRGSGSIPSIGPNSRAPSSLGGSELYLMRLWTSTRRAMQLLLIVRQRGDRVENSLQPGRGGAMGMYDCYQCTAMRLRARAALDEAASVEEVWGLMKRVRKCRCEGRSSSSTFAFRS